MARPAVGQDSPAQQPEGPLSIPETARPPVISGRTPTSVVRTGGATSSGPSERVHCVPEKRTKNMPAGRPSEQEAGSAWFYGLCRRPGSSGAANRELERRVGAAWMALGAGEGFAKKEALR